MFTPEAIFHHQTSQAKIGILLVNLGTPNHPTKTAVKPYLKQFLSDKRVVELPTWLWRMVLNTIILNTRPKKSAAKYQNIWLPEGSPLAVYTQRQTNKLKALFETPNLIIDYAMRYGDPAISKVLNHMQQQGVNKLLVLPLYPQYASSSSGTVLEEVFRLLSQQRNIMDLRTIKHFHDHPAYIQAIGQSIKKYWQTHKQADKLLFSFHGVPLKTLQMGDPYFCECHKSARLIAKWLNLSTDDYIVAFQSRFGTAKWVGPSTQSMLQELPKQGIKNIDVICPGFVSDCLETLEEVVIEGKNTFIHSGGNSLNYIPCLNDQQLWITALQKILQPHLYEWEIKALNQDALTQRQHNQQNSRLK